MDSEKLVISNFMFIFMFPFSNSTSTGNKSHFRYFNVLCHVDYGSNSKEIAIGDPGGMFFLIAMDFLLKRKEKKSVVLMSIEQSSSILGNLSC